MTRLLALLQFALWLYGCDVGPVSTIVPPAPGAAGMSCQRMPATVGQAAAVRCVALPLRMTSTRTRPQQP